MGTDTHFAVALVPDREPRRPAAVDPAPHPGQCVGMAWRPPPCLGTLNPKPLKRQPAPPVSSTAQDGSEGVAVSKSRPSCFRASKGGQRRR